MPLVRISLREGTTAEYQRAIADGVHQAMIDAIAIPAQDRFQLISEYSSGNLVNDPDYLGVKRSDHVVFVQIMLSTGRKPGQKRALFKRITELLAKASGVRPEDVLVNLVEVSWEN
jgi:phenylpyruvate tautomerase PptA (4-oxalocrotonate tautomerase family)